MSCYLVKVENGHKVARSITSENEYRALRGSSAQNANLRLARQGNDQAKRRLLQVNYSGHYPDGVVKGCKLPSKAFGFDLDDKESFEKAAAKLLAEPEKYGLLMLERSVRQGGHAVFRRERGKTILENQVRIAMMLGCEMDTSAHDINRVYFTTSDSADDLLFLSPQLFADAYDKAEVEAEAAVLEAREKEGREELPEGAHKANKHFMPNCAGGTPTPPATPVVDCYLGVPYAEIIKMWWKMYNDGREPVRSNRDVLTFELAVNLRHICGFDRELMRRVIPCYDGFPEEQKMKCIDSALAERRTQMPKRLKDLLMLVRNMADKTVEAAFDEAMVQDELFFTNRLPKMPLGVRDSIEAVGPQMALPMITAICPAIGALATGVELDVHGTMRGLNLIAYIAGDFASGKGGIDPVVEAWTNEVKELDKMYQAKEDDWRRKKRAAKNKKEQPEEPKLPVRCLTLNNTVANLAERLANTEGKHAFSFTPEADTVVQKWKTAMSDFSVMLRQAYDGTSYEREARSAEAVNVHIEKLLWNVTLCGTPDALYRVVNNYTDGFQSRIALASTPDNTFAPLEEKPRVLTDLQRERIQKVAHLLPLMTGKVVLPKLEARGREWVEAIRLETMKNDDKVKARQRFRICVTAQRMTCCLMLCRVCEQLIQKYGPVEAEKRLKQSDNLWVEMLQRQQTPQMLDAYDVIADYLIDNALRFFRDRIEEAFGSRNYAGFAMGERTKRGKNDSIFARLDVQFSFEQAMQHSVAVKGASVTTNSVQLMLRNWKKQGLVEKLDDGSYRKK
ncbi:MAG: DUF3987 domain-containing protein [Prevotella sp.]